MTLRVATYNVHGCVGIDRRRSEARIAEVIASLNADIVGLQELDTNRNRSARVNQAAFIAEQLGWNYIFEAAMRRGDEQYGNAIISRYPLKLHRAIELPGHGNWYCRETRAALWAETETEIGRVGIINTHFALSRTERVQQAERLVEAIESNESLIVLGDFNSLPGSRTHQRLTSRLHDARRLTASRARTFPTRLPLFAVDHILMNANLRALNVQVHRNALARTASDHYPLVAEVVLAL